MYALQRTTQKLHIKSIKKHNLIQRKRQLRHRACKFSSSVQQGAVLSVTSHHSLGHFTQAPSLSFITIPRQMLLNAAP